MTVDSHFIAAIDLIGLTLSVIGGLYLAYDLLGSKHGSLRIMTRALTYGLLFAITYTAFLGLTFGIVAAIGMGSILGFELIRVSPGDQRQRTHPYIFAALRGFTLGLATALTFGALMGVIFGVLVAVGLGLVYRLRFSPSATYEPSARPKLTTARIVASLARGAASMVAGIVAGAIAPAGIGVGLKIGLVIGIASLFLGIFSPVVEWRVNNLTEREMGAIGLFLILIGFVLQSLESWLTLFSVRIS